MPSKLDFSSELGDKVVLVTGGSSGIGKETANILADNGAKVAVTYNRRREAAEAVQARHPERISIHQLDLADPGSITRAMREAFDQWSGLDAVINNAAAGSATIANHEPEAAQRDEAMFRINAVGALKVAQEGLRLMRERKDPQHPGKIINVSSVGGGISVFPEFLTSDGMSKAAVAFMTKQMASEHMDGDIHILALCPGATETDMLQKSTLDSMGPEELAAFCAQLPGRRLIRPEEIAVALSTFVASDTLSGIFHGAVIDASMGLGVRPGKMSEMKHG